jgi:hypothetical protein
VGCSDLWSVEISHGAIITSKCSHESCVKVVNKSYFHSKLQSIVTKTRDNIKNRLRTGQPSNRRPIPVRSKRFYLHRKVQTVPGPSQLPIWWLSGALSRGYSGRDVKLTIHFYLVPVLRMRGCIPSLLHLQGVVLNYAQAQIYQLSFRYYRIIYRHIFAFTNIENGRLKAQEITIQDPMLNIHG